MGDLRFHQGFAIGVDHQLCKLIPESSVSSPDTSPARRNKLSLLTPIDIIDHVTSSESSLLKFILLLLTLFSLLGTLIDRSDEEVEDRGFFLWHDALRIDHDFHLTPPRRGLFLRVPEPTAPETHVCTLKDLAFQLFPEAEGP